MSYHQVTGLSFGATDSDDNIIEKCGQKIKAADLDTKAGREESVKTGAECAADGFCAAYKVPPGVCGPIAKTVAGQAIKVWNSIFGDDSAQRRAIQRMKDTAEYFAATQNLMEVEAQMSQELAKLTKGLIDYHDQMIPTRKGMLGVPAGTPGKPTGDQPMRQVLADNGMIHVLHKIGAYIVPPKLYHDIMQGEARSWAAAETKRRQEACNKQYPVNIMGQRPMGGGYQFCLMEIPKQIVLETEYINRLAVEVPKRFYESMDQAALKARAYIAAEAVKVRVMQYTAAGAKAGATAAFSGGKAAGLILLAGAAASAIIIYRRK